MSLILDGKIVRDHVAHELEKFIKTFPSKPTLAIIQVGNLEESDAYIKQKELFAVRIGAKVRHIKVDAKVEPRQFFENISNLNTDPEVNGVIIQLPLPEGLPPEMFVEAIDPAKDVDGLTAVNLKALYGKKDGFVPATALGILSLLRYYKVSIEGKKITVVGRSMLVGKPTALVFINENATVTVAHSKTERLEECTKEADILIVAIGVPKFINDTHVIPGQIVVDVGINIIETGTKLNEEITGRKLVGDVDFEKVKNIIGSISPVPGGVGPMTVATLFQNLVKAYAQQNKIALPAEVSNI